MPIPLLFLIIFALGTALSYAITRIIIFVHRTFKKNNIPLGGGTGIYVSFILLVLLLWSFIANTDSAIISKHIVGFIIGGGIITLGGFLDDKYNLTPGKQIIFPVLATMVVIISGVGVNYITNPLEPDKLIYLDFFESTVVTIKGIPYHVTLPADIVSFIWLMLIMYATKLQDGLDGLVSGVSLIATAFVIVISYFVFQEFGLSILATIFAGTLFGFLLLNKFPAKIYLGEGGSLLAGFMLGVFAIASDAKVTITFLIIALPIIDALWAIVRRISRGGKPWDKDFEHLHHRLVKVGMSHKSSVWLLYAITILFGLLVLLWQSSFTYYFWGFLMSILIVILALFGWAYRDRHYP